MVRFDVGSLVAELREMGSRAPLIMSRSLNRAQVAGLTAMVRAITADTGIAAKNVKQTVVTEKASRTQLVAAVTISGARLPLIAFSARGPEPSRGKGRGVSYRALGQRGRIPEAFIATMKSGHRGVFKRKGALGRKVQGPRGHVETRSGNATAGAGRLPIMELRGVSIPHIAEKYLDVFQAAAQDALEKNLRHEIDFANRPTAEAPAMSAA